MNQWIVATTALAGLLLSVGSVNAETERLSENTCEAGWAYVLYKACENPNKPIPAEGEDKEVCGTTDVELVNDKLCGRPTYKKCRVKSKKVGKWKKTSEVITYSSKWLHGDADNGQDISWYCKQVVNNWNKNNTNPRKRVKPIKLRKGLEKSKNRVTHRVYKYQCDLKVEKGRYLVKKKKHKSCGVAHYADCTIRVPKTCVDKAFATEYASDRREECGEEKQTKFGFANTSEKDLFAQNQNGVATNTCLSCDSVDDQQDRAECIVERFRDFSGEMTKEESASIYNENMAQTLISLVEDEEVLEDIQSYTKFVIEGLYREAKSLIDGKRFNSPMVDSYFVSKSANRS